MELFKLRVQNIQGVLFSFFFHYWSILYAENLCPKQVRGYFLVYSSLISIVHLMLVIFQKMGSWQATGCFLVYYATFLIQKKCVFKGSGNLLFSLLNYFSNMKKMCLQIKWKPATFLIRKMCVQNKRWAAFQFIKLLFVIQKMCVQNKRGAAF